MTENLKRSKLFCWGFLAEVSYFRKKKFSVALKWQKPSKMLIEFLNL